MPWEPNDRRMKELPRDWRAIRKIIIARDNGRCVFCGQPGTDVDHIERGMNHALSNLRLLCHPCHMARTGRDGGTAPRGPSALSIARKARGEDHPGIIRR